MAVSCRVNYDVLNEVPPCFDILRNIGRLNVVTYGDLGQRRFSDVEKVFLCQEVQKSRDDEPTLLASTGVIAGRETVTLKGLAERYNLSLHTITGWFKRFQKGEVLQGSLHKGAPNAVDEEETERIRLIIIKRDEEKRPVSDDELAQILGEAKRISAAKRGRIIAPMDAVVDRKTVTAFCERVGISLRKAQFMTSARIDALLDCRLTYKMAVAYKALGEMLPGPLKWNADCTTVQCDFSGEEQRFCVIREHNDHEQVASTGVTGDLSLIVKLFGLGNAGGEIGPLTAIVAVKEIPEGEFFALPVRGFTCSTEVGAAPGWVYLCRTKGGNAKLWRHWFLNVCVPTIVKSANAHNFQVKIRICIM